MRAKKLRVNASDFAGVSNVDVIAVYTMDHAIAAHTYGHIVPVIICLPVLWCLKYVLTYRSVYSEVMVLACNCPPQANLNCLPLNNHLFYFLRATICKK